MSTPTHENLAAALAAFQAELPSIPKGATGQVPGKRTHKYADLSDLSARVLPVLARHGLSFSAKPTLNEAGAFGLLYVLRHASGDADEGFYPLPQGSAWEIGSAITYGRRYCLSAVTGVAADEDDDGHAAQHATNGRTVGRGEPPAEPPKRTAKDARAQLAADADRNGWDLDRIAALFAEQHDGRQIAQAENPQTIDKFRESLYAVSDQELKAPAANGAAQ